MNTSTSDDSICQLASSNLRPVSSRPDSWIVIKTLIGRIYLWKFTNSNVKIGSIKEYISRCQDGISVGEQRLIYGGNSLEDDRTLSDYGIRENSIIFLISISKISDRKYFQIQNPSGKNIFCIWRDEKRIVKCKEEIEGKELIPIQEQIFIFNNMELDNQGNLSYYRINDGSLVHLMIRLNNGRLKIFEDDLLDPPFDYDFTNINDQGGHFVRGGEVYLRPCGWNRIALKVEGKYENDLWLGSGSDDSNRENEWASAYHGTNLDGLKGISLNGFNLDKLKRGLFGWGHYTTPFIEIAEEYATPIEVNGVKIKYIIQSRVDPKKIIKRNDEKYWILPNNDDLRPYGICFKICEDKSVPPPPPPPPPPPAAASG